MKFHPYADIFPMLEGPEADALTQSMRDHGFDPRHPIVVHDGKILDGRNRWRAAKAAKVQPVTVAFRGKDPLGYVLLANLLRRHLNESQRAMVGARIKGLFEADAKERVGGRPKKGVANLPPVSAGKARDKAGAAVNVGGRSVESAAKVIATGTPELIAAVDAGKIAVSAAASIVGKPAEEQRALVAMIAAGGKPAAAISEMRRRERVQKHAAISRGNVPLGLPQRYPIILADPPWRYEHAGSDSRQIENHYPTMDLADICALDVGALATDDAILFLWATSPKLEESMQVLDAWGFTYRTCAVWDKERVGMGYYFRQQHELLLVGARGEPTHPAPKDRVSSVIRTKRDNRHSAKPIEVYEIIERMYPELPKLELFARSPRKGWSAWGNEAQPVGQGAA